MSYHNPVMLKESIEGLNIKPSGCYVDATFGGGGHSVEILKKLNSKGKLIAFDQDADSIANKIDDDRFILLNQNFMYLKKFLRYLNFNTVDGILADLGVSSYQIDTPSKGFSTRFDSQLDMRMDTSKSLRADIVVNSYPEEKLSWIFKNYGEIENYRKLASQIVEVRKTNEILTVNDLKQIANKFSKPQQENKYLAQVFQALRMEVNKEVDVLISFLKQSIEILNPEGRLVVISYHSIEDRIVKNFIKSGNEDGIIEKDFYGNAQKSLQIITKKPLIASNTEVKENPRSRSAKLRIGEKV